MYSFSRSPRLRALGFVLLLVPVYWANADTAGLQISATDPDAERMLQANQHLLRGEGAAILKRKDGTSIILGVGMATVADERSKYMAEAEKHAKLKIIELVRGTNVSTQQRMVSEQNVSIKGAHESASMSEKLTEDTQVRTAGSVRNAATVANWMSPDKGTYFVALLQRNETVYLPERTGIRVDLGRGVEWLDFIPPELRSSRSEFANGERRKKELLDEMAIEIRDSVLSTLAKQKRYILTTEKDSASMISEIKTESFKTKIEGAPGSGKRSLQVSVSGSMRLYTEATSQEFFRTEFAAGSSKVPFVKADDFDAALDAAKEEVVGKLRTSLRQAKCSLMSKLGVARLVFGENGNWMLGEGVDSGLLGVGDRVSLWRGEGEGAVKVAECVLGVENDALVLNGFQANGGDVFGFKMEACAQPVRLSLVPVPEPPAPASPAPKSSKKRPN